MSSKVSHQACGVVLLPSHVAGQLRLLNPVTSQEVLVSASSTLHFEASGWGYIIEGDKQAWVNELLPAPVMQTAASR
eukprot:4583968-Lingulodinium_polyedra.AAC.1